MPRNEAMWDRGGRVIVGAVLLYFALGPALTGLLAAILSLAGTVLVLTGLVGWCPLYSMVGVRTGRTASRPTS